LAVQETHTTAVWQTEARTARARWVTWAAVFGLWTAFGLLNASQLYLGLRAEGMDHAFGRIATWQVLNWWVWGAYTPLVLWLGRRFPFARGRLARAFAVHAAAFLALVFVYAALSQQIMIAVGPWGHEAKARPFWDMLWGRLTSQFHFNLLIYGAILGVGYAFDYHRKFREREVRATQLEGQLAQAQLQALRMQLHPHFLFNTLNGIAGLVRESQNKAAVQMIAGLSDLLRYALENAGKQEVPLREELEFLELYLNIQQMRFPDRLRVRMEIEPETLDARVPNLILQPLVENAIRYGVAPRASAGTVGVSTRREDGELELRVYDDGPGLRRAAPTAEDAGAGIGLRNTRARLGQLYGAGHRFEVGDRAEGGCEARIRIPFRRASENGDG
jgi:two-component system LytT family sensor kinase